MIVIETTLLQSLHTSNSQYKKALLPMLFPLPHHHSLQDRFAIGRFEPEIDESQDWILTGHLESGGRTVLEFSRKLITCDERDIAIQVSRDVCKTRVLDKHIHPANTFYNVMPCQWIFVQGVATLGLMSTSTVKCIGINYEKVRLAIHFLHKPFHGSGLGRWIYMVLRQHSMARHSFSTKPSTPPPPPPWISPCTMHSMMKMTLNMHE